MTIHSIHSDDGKSIIIGIIGRFDYSLQKSFCAAFEKAEKCINNYIVDMKETTYLDSSALGLLLLLRGHANTNSSDVNIVNCNENIKKILSISKFENMFNIE